MKPSIHQAGRTIGSLGLLQCRIRGAFLPSLGKGGDSDSPDGDESAASAAADKRATNGRATIASPSGGANKFMAQRLQQSDRQAKG
jgi:hypothetical protein